MERKRSGGLNREAGLINFPPLKTRFMVFFHPMFLLKKVNPSE